MSDVARHAGVSNAAASAVLSGKLSSARVSELTRQRVLQSAQLLRYTPNEVARALRRQRTDIIGLYLWHEALDTHGAFLAEIVSGLQHGCDAHQKDLLIHGTFRGQSVDDIRQRLINGKIDGLVLFAVPGDPLVDLLAATSLPVVTVADAVPPLPAVVADDRAGSSLLAEYLVAKGHRCVLYRKGLISKTSAARRHASFCEAASARGLTVLEDGERQFGAVDGFSTWEQRLLALPRGERPSAIACWNDDLADCTIECCLQMGLRVPEDVAVVGFDGLVSQARPSRRITTVHAPWSEVARTALDLLMRRLSGEDIPLETVLPVELVIGETS